MANREKAAASELHMLACVNALRIMYSLDIHELTAQGMEIGAARKFVISWQVNNKLYTPPEQFMRYGLLFQRQVWAAVMARQSDLFKEAWSE